MPIYEYKCSKCDNTIEKWNKDLFDKDEICPKCKNKMKKIISSSTFILKGGGWYSDGYNKKKE